MNSIVNMLKKAVVTLALVCGCVGLAQAETVAKIGTAEYESLAAAISAATAGQTVEIVQAGSYAIPSPIDGVTIDGSQAGGKSLVIFDASKGSGNLGKTSGKVAFKAVGFKFGSSSYTGFQHPGEISFADCSFEGLFYSYGTMNFSNCSFKQTDYEYMMWCYAGDCTYLNCTFDGNGKFFNIYNEGNANTDSTTGEKIPWKITFTGCTFTSSQKKKAPLNIKETCGSTPLYYTVDISNCKVLNDNFPDATEFDAGTALYVISPLVQVDDRNTTTALTDITVTLDGKKVYENGAAVVSAPVKVDTGDDTANEVTVSTESSTSAVDTTKADTTSAAAMSETATVGDKTKTIAENMAASTAVTGVKLTTKAIEATETTAKVSSGVQAVVTAAKTAATTTQSSEEATEAAKAEATKFAEIAPTADNVSIQVNVDVVPTTYVAPTTGESTGSVTFKLEPSATVTVSKGTESASQVVPVTNDMIDQTQKISVSLYTGFKPAQIIHHDDGTVIETFEGDDEITYDSTTGIATVKISHFSEATANETVCVAQIGSTGYTTLAAALAAVENGQTITLLKDVAEAVSVTRPANADFTIDYGAYTMSGNINVGYSTSSTTSDKLTLKGSGEISGKTYIGQDAATGRSYAINCNENASIGEVYIRQNGQLNVSGGAEVISGYPCVYGAINVSGKSTYKVSNKGNANFYVAGRSSKNAKDKAIITVDDSTLDFTGGMVALEMSGGFSFTEKGSGKLILKNGAKAIGTAVWMGANADGSLGTIAVEMTDSTLTLSDTVQKYANLVIGEGDYVSLKNSTISLKSITNNGTITIDATGLTAATKVIDYTGEGTMALADYGTVNVTGGQAYVEDNDLYVAVPVAKIGETKYYTFDDAIAAVKSGETITVLNYNSETMTAPDGWKFVTDDAGVTTLVAKVYIAQVGDTKYDDLAKALTAAKTAGMTCTLLSDVALTGNWTPITDFNGTFDGQGHTITGLKVEGGSNLGLFANTGTSATVKDLTISGATITSTSGEYHGVLAGQIAGSVISGVKIVNSTVTNSGTTEDADMYTGGLCGTGYPHMSNCEVTDCTITGNDQVGGVIGYLWVGYIENCKVTGNTTVKANTSRAGGLVGKIQVASGNLGSSSMWINGNTVSGTVTALDMVGGIAAQIMGDSSKYEIKNNTIDVTFGTSAATSPIGVLRSSNVDNAFTQNLTKNVTGNWWEDTTSSSDSYTFSNAQTTAAGATYTVYRGVAKVVSASASKCYQTLAAAIDAATAGDTVTLLVDIDLSSEGLALNKAVTLDLNGNNIKVGEGATTDINITANVTIKDSSASADGKIYTEQEYTGSVTGYGVIRVTGATLTWESGNLEAVMSDAANKGQFGITAANGSKVIVNGGTIKAGWYAYSNNGTLTGDIALVVNGGELISTADYAIYNPARNASVTITGGTVSGYAGGVCLNGGTFTMTGGLVTTKGQGSTGTWGDGTGNTGKAAILINAKYAASSATISGGSVTAEGATDVLGTGTANSATIAVSGGTFSSAVPEKYCASGYIPTYDSTTGTYGVKAGSYVAQIGTTKYETIDAAVKAATTGDTIKLLADLTDTGAINLPAGVTLDGNGKKVSGNSAVYVNAAGGTVKNVNFEDNHNSTSILSPIYGSGLTGTMTVTGCTFKNWDWDAIQITPAAATANITITGNTFTAEAGENVHRGVHIQSSPTRMAFSANVTGNKFYGVENLSETYLEVYDFTDKNSVTVSGNYLDGTAAACILMNGYADDVSDMILPLKDESLQNNIATVAKIRSSSGNSYYYQTLAKAIAAVPTTGTTTTITMIADETMAAEATLTIATGKNILLDLNGYTVSGSGSSVGKNFYFIYQDTKSTLVIDDTSTGKAGTITMTPTAYDSGYSTENVTIYSCGGTLTIKNGTIANNAPGGLAYAVNSSSNAWGTPIDTYFTFEGGTITAPHGDAAVRIYQNAGSQTSHNYVNISGGTILDTGIFLDTFSYQGRHDDTITVVNITGGTINGLIDLKLRNECVSFNITGGTFGNCTLRARNRKSESPYFDTLTKHIVTITGGKFSFASAQTPIWTYHPDVATDVWTETSVNPFIISGGVYTSQSIPEASIASGLAVVANTDTTTSSTYPYAIGAATNTIVVGTKGEALSGESQSVISSAESNKKDGTSLAYTVVNAEGTVESENRNQNFADLSTGTYTMKVTYKDKDTDTSITKDVVDVGVIQVTKQPKIILAVPWKAVNGQTDVTVNSLFDAKAAGIKDGATLNVYVESQSAYVSFAYENGAWTDATHSGDDVLDPATTTIARGSAALLENAGTDTASIALVGHYDSTATEPESSIAPSSVGMTVNVTTGSKLISQLTPQDSTTNTNLCNAVRLIVPGVTANQQYTYKNGAWTKPATTTTTFRGHDITYTYDAPIAGTEEVPAGTGVWVQNLLTTEDAKVVTSQSQRNE